MSYSPVVYWQIKNTKNHKYHLQKRYMKAYLIHVLPSLFQHLCCQLSFFCKTLWIFTVLHQRICFLQSSDLCPYFPTEKHAPLNLVLLYSFGKKRWWPTVVFSFFSPWLLRWRCHHQFSRLLQIFWAVLKFWNVIGASFCVNTVVNVL